MKKKVLKSVLPILCVAFTVAGFAACKDGEEHVHTYSTEWSKDAEGHWYDVTCDCADAPENPKLPHVDKNNDSLCDICEYDYGHTHTYETDTWTVNCQQHWHAATCGHVVVGIEQGDHVDTDEDGKCDTCQYVIKDIHVHVFDDEWTSNDEYHWYAALCEHKDEIADKEEHVLNAAGECTVCGEQINEVDVTNIGAVLAAAADKSYMVIDGKVAYENTVYDGVAGSYTVGNWTDQDIYYVLGNNASYRTETITNASGTTIDQYWFELANPEDDKLFCLQLEGGKTELVMLDGPMYALNGYAYYPGSILKDLDAPKLEDAILGLYNILVAKTHISNANSAYDAETGVYSFSYSYFTVNPVSGGETLGGTGDETTDGDTSDNTISYEAELYEVAVQFTVDANKVINWVDFSVAGYRDTALDDDIDYDPITDTVTKNAGANPTVYAYVVTQTSGERTYTTPYPKASVVPTDFELLYVTETERDDNSNRVPVATAAIENNALTFEAGISELLAIGKVYPVSSNPAFFNGDDIQVSMVSKDDPSVTCYAYYGWQYMTIGFYTKPGNWTLTVTCGEIVKVIDVTVNPAKATDISAQVFTSETDYWGETNYVASSATAITVKEGETFDFTAVVSPNTASQEFTYSLDKSTGATITEVTLEKAIVNNEYFETYTAYQFKADVAGTYVITVKDKDNIVSATLTVTVAKEGTLALPYEITAAGDYTCEFPDGFDRVWYTYTPSKDGYLTVSTTFGENACLMVGTDQNALVNNDGNGKSVTTHVNANTLCYIVVGYLTKVESIPFTVAFEEDTTGGDEEGKYNTVIVVGTNTLYFSADEVKADAAERSATITKADNYSFKAGNLFIAGIDDSTGTAVTRNSDYTYTLSAGTYTVKFGMLSMFHVSADVAYELNVVGSTEEEDTDEPVGSLEAGKANVITVTDANIEAGSILYSFFAYEAGDYKIMSNSLMITVKDEDGNEIEGTSGVFTLDSYTSYLVEIGTQYVFSAGEYTVNVEYQAPLGHEDNPIELELGENKANYKGDYAPVWYYFVATEDGTLTLTAQDTTATLMVGLVSGNEKESEDGTVSLALIAGNTYRIGVANFEGGYGVAVEVVFEASFTAGEITRDGTINVPYELVLNNNSATVEQYGSVFFTYTAEKEGTLTLTAGDNSDMNIVSPDYVGAEDGIITVQLKEGESFILCIGTADWAAGEVSFTATFKGAPTSVSTDLAYSGTDNELTIADNTYLYSELYVSGSYTIEWDVQGVIVTVNGQAVENGDVFTSSNPRSPVVIVIYGENYAAVSALKVTVSEYVAPLVELKLNENTVTVTDTFNGTTVEFNATEAGTYIFTAGTNAVLGYDYSNYLAGESFSVVLEEGDKVQFAVYTEDYSMGDVVVTVSVKSDSSEGGDVDASTDTAIKLVGNGVYASSTVSGGNLAVAASANAAAVFYLEEADNGLYHIYFMDNGTKTYLNCDGSSNSSIGTSTDAASATNWSLDETNKHIVVDGATDWTGQNRVLVYDYASGTYVFRSKTTGNINNTSCYAVWYELA